MFSSSRMINILQKVINFFLADSNMLECIYHFISWNKRFELGIFNVDLIKKIVVFVFYIVQDCIVIAYIFFGRSFVSWQETHSPDYFCQKIITTKNFIH